MKSVSNDTSSPPVCDSPASDRTRTKRLHNRCLNSLSGSCLPTFHIASTQNDSSCLVSTLDNSEFTLPPGGATTPPCLNPAFGSPTFSSTNSSSFWGSIFNPMKKLWEIPTIHLSTYYGLPNQPGRPGPVLAVLVERSASVNRSKQKRQHQQQKSSSASGSTFNRVGVDLKSSFLGFTKNSGGGNALASKRSYMDFIPDVEGILVVTPLAIEKYQLNGTIVKRAALPAAIAAFICTKIAGVGKVFLCGTHKGEIHVLKADLLDSMLIFGTGCLKGKFLNKLIRTKVNDVISVLPSEASAPRNSSSHSSHYSYAQSVEPSTPSVFADPPRLFSEMLLAMHSSSCNLALSTAKAKSTAATTEVSSGEATADCELSRGSSSELMMGDHLMGSNGGGDASSVVGGGCDKAGGSDRLSVLHKLGSFTGDGMTPALIEGKSRNLFREDLDVEEMLLCFGSGGAGGGNSSTAADSEVRCSNAAVAHEVKKIPGLTPSVTLQEKLAHMVDYDVDFMKEFSANIRNEKVGVCSLAVKCSFGSFTEAILAGTEDGEVFVWAVPSGRLLYVLEHPSCYCQTKRCDSASEDSLMQQEAPEASANPSKTNGVSVLTGAADKQVSIEQAKPSNAKSNERYVSLLHSEQQQIQWQEVDGSHEGQKMNGGLESMINDQGIDQGVSRSSSSADSSRFSPSPKSSPGVYVASIKVVHSKRREHHVYVGYGDGCVAVFDFNTATFVRCWKVEPENGPVTAIEISSELGCVIILSGNTRLSIWSFNSSDLVKTFAIAELTAGVPISYLKVVDPEKRLPIGPTAIVFSGCVDGSIYVHRLSWESPSVSFIGSSSSSPQESQATASYGTLLLPSNLPSNHSVLNAWSGVEVGTPVHSMESIQWRRSLPSELQCVPVKHFKRECGPSCPVTSLWIDTSLDTAFIGDASGVAATLLPIRYLLEASAPPAPRSSASSPSSLRAIRSQNTSSSERSAGERKHSNHDAAKPKHKSRTTAVQHQSTEVTSATIIASKELNEVFPPKS